MNFVSPTSIISVALLCHLQVNCERITEWLAIIQSLQTLQQKKKWDCFLYKILINVSNIKHCIWPHDHMCISEYSAWHFINNSPTISKSRLINLLWLNIIITFNHSKFKFIDLDSSLEEQYGFLKGLNLFFFESSWTYGKISLVALNQVSQFVQKSSPVWCIHCSPRTAQFEGLLGCFYSDINVCLDIRFKATSIKFEFKIHASALIYTATSMSTKLYNWPLNRHYFKIQPLSAVGASNYN